MRKYNKSLLLILIGFSTHFRAAACTTPVFRYALERWSPYPYVLEIIHDAPFNEEQSRALHFLQSAIKKGANIRIIETTSLPDPAKSSKIDREDLPLVRLFYPAEQSAGRLIWKGSLTVDQARKITDSPARRKIATRIAEGDAAVWVMLMRRGSPEDSRAADLLEEQLTLLSKELQLPEAATDSSGKPLDLPTGSMDVKFSMVRVRAEDPEEEVFAQILKKSEPDLFIFRDPMAFPVFGRGRVMYALVGNGISSQNILTACSTIIGWCSCTIKESNPGQDLLMTADWAQAIGDSSWIAKEELPEVTGLSGFFKDPKGKGGMPVLPKDTGIRVTPPKPLTVPATLAHHPASIKISRSDNPGLSASTADQGSTKGSETANHRLTRNLILTVSLILVSVFALAYLFRPKEK